MQGPDWKSEKVYRAAARQVLWIDELLGLDRLIDESPQSDAVIDHPKDQIVNPLQTIKHASVRRSFKI